ncbi:MAG: metallophosphoesterase [Acidisphaera sp.]|nr:metallophosphoesterase [Acidisphaera sp.]
MSGTPPGTGIPPGMGVRVVGDVHGDLRAFAHAVQTGLFVLQLGDLVDYGPDSAGVLRLMLRLLEEGRGVFLLGNHELRLARALAGRTVRMTDTLAATLAQLDPGLRERTLAAIAAAPAWIRWHATLFVHGGFHTAMLESPPPHGAPIGGGRVQDVLARALYGEPTGRTQPDGYPERSLRWVDRIPRGLTVYCGHDRRSIDGRPYRRAGRAGGEAVFLDTGAGKGGHLSWIDLKAPQ